MVVSNGSTGWVPREAMDLYRSCLVKTKRLLVNAAVNFSSGSTSRVRGPRNIKSMRPPLTYFAQGRGGAWPPRPPPLDPLLNFVFVGVSF